LFHSLPLDSSSSTRRKNDEDNMSLESSYGSKRRRFKDEAFSFSENADVISLDDDEVEVKIDESSLDSENPITICSDEEKDDVIFSKEENWVFLDDSDEDDVDCDYESKDDETSDEDFKADELNEVSEDDDDDSYGHEGKKKTRMRTNFDVVEELERKVMDKESEISIHNEENEIYVTNSTTKK
jgi:hypothetical protein